MEEIGEARNDVPALLLGQFLRGITRFFLGEFIAARPIFEQCHGLSDPSHRTVYAALVPQDPHATMLAQLALTLTYLGYVDQGRARMNEALSDVRRLGHVYSLVVVLLRACWMECAASLPQEAQRHAEEAVDLSNEHGFQFWLGWGFVYRGWSLTALGQAKEGCTLLTKGLSLCRATGAVTGIPWALILLTEAYAKLGRTVEGLNCLDEAAQLIETTHERYSEAELHRLRGDLLNATGGRSAAEQNYHQALGVAKRQSARLFKLRAASSLARLWRDQGKVQQARELLAPVYGWFREGFDTRDLKEAKALLEELGRNGFLREKTHKTARCDALARYDATRTTRRRWMAQEARELICMITRGTDHELSSVGFTIANFGITAGLKVFIFLSSSGVDLVRKRAADTTQVNPLEPLAKLINDFMTRGGTIWACTPCAKSRGYGEETSLTELSSQEQA
jgi:predicted ATPase/predicted peroxiredoxin